jgi:capsule polysaccharide modification protein KpsS
MMNGDTKKPKILFWLDGYLIHFGIAKYIKENLDCDLSAIINTNDVSRDFFETQKIVEFKKTWYFRDHVSEIGKPDLDYLSNFEKKYGISLWKTAYAERFFYGYTKYREFSQSEILKITECESRLFEKILDEEKPDYVIMRKTDYHHIHLLSLLCQSKKIPTLILTPFPLAFRSFVALEPDFVLDKISEISNSQINLDKIKEYSSGYSKQFEKTRNSFRSSDKKRIKAFFKFFFKMNNKKYTNYYGNAGKTKLNILKTELKQIFLSKYRRRFIDKQLEKSFDHDDQFVYYPLHFEPERTLLIPGAFYTNQHSVITNIAKSIPADFTLYVKEHPQMKLTKWRNVNFYKEIMKLPNVKLLHPDVSSSDLLSHSKLVLTVAGTSGFEATIHGKPTIVFSDTLYSNLSSVFRVHGFEELNNTILQALKTKVNFNELQDLVDQMNSMSIFFDDRGMLIEMYDLFAYGGFLSDAEIGEDDMKNFLNKHEKSFNEIAKLHIEKINLC